MRINPQQEAALSDLRCVRVRDASPDILKKIVGPKYNSHLVELFRNSPHIDDEKYGHLASYIILAPEPDDTVLVFFSLRCGELFEKVDYETLKIAHEAYEAIKLLSKNPSGTAIRDSAMKAIQKAVNLGLDIFNLEPFVIKKSKYNLDEGMETDKNVSRVSKVFSAVELKFYGINEEGKKFWNEKKLFPHRMGLTLYWTFIIPKLEELQKIAGCQYMYLFAADGEPEGHLVTYYRNALHINANKYLSANKPHFDYMSQFLYQEISELNKQRDFFFDTFNREDIDDDVV